MKDEVAMKAWFEEWITEYGKRYKNKEEKARRYELFKAFANMVGKAIAEVMAAENVQSPSVQVHQLVWP
ncbi:unnamed protein product [Miscanthus lutarioriparius]|uniref:Cathepsin propeptide inhibitor domain-containing protein n=1 Tax=Miscanthus lutarioriparius TaxID=422564 RepID=A0A811RJD3_9POAL|nr:unnamed protein product [Miscanthus lutarioriparius]